MGKNTPSHAEEDMSRLESPKSPDRQIIPRRFPRIGSQFQTRIAKWSDPLDRPPPDRMSREYPYTTETEAIRSGKSNVSVLKTGYATFPLPHDIDQYTSFLSTSRRGGILVCASRDMKQYSTFVQPFITSLSSSPQTQITSQAWVQHMIHLHSTEGTGRRKRTQRGAFKRKRGNEDELVWSQEKVLQSQSDSRQRKKSISTMLGEDEAVAFGYLELKFQGNAQAGMLNTIAGLSGGQATKMRKREKMKFMKQRSPSPNASMCWRVLYERIAFPFASSIRGQLQDEKFVDYNVDENVQQAAAVGNDADGIFVDFAFDSDELKRAWIAILACGKSIERQLNGELSVEKKLLLPTLLTFVGNAYRLPLPDTCFEAHHAVLKEVSNSMMFILGHIQRAQQVQASIRDNVFNEAGGGIDSESLKRILDEQCGTLPIELPEANQLYESRAVIVDWECRLSSLLDTGDEDSEMSPGRVRLEDAENFRAEARTHGYQSRALVQLVCGIQKARDLRLRILIWKDSFCHGGRGSLKILSALVKEINRINLSFAEADEVLALHRLTESWIDRACVVTRSKSCLCVIQSLIRAAKAFPLDLTEYLDKLKTRVRSAEQWLDALEEVVPHKHLKKKKLEWFRNLNSALYNVDQVSLYELSSEGNRMPVVVEEAMILQVAIDAKNWTTKAKKWLPDVADSKEGKICDLREHLARLAALRDRLPFSDFDIAAWSPDGEKQLSAIVDAAETWFEKYEGIVAGNNITRTKNVGVVSVKKLIEIVAEANRIFANMGATASIMSKLLCQAQAWYTSHLYLLRRCGLIEEPEKEEIVRRFVKRSDLQSAIEDAETNISIHIEEAITLKNILEKIDHWHRRVGLIAPKRSKRSGRTLSKLTLPDLLDLIAESTELPIDTNDDTHRLQLQLSTIESWRKTVSAQMHRIVEGFQSLQSRVLLVYGVPEDFDIEFYTKPLNLENTFSGDFKSSHSSTETDMQLLSDTSDIDVDDILSNGSSSGLDVFRQIKDLREASKDICVITSEGELINLLDTVATWCVRSLKYLNAPREIFDKRYYVTFDRFLIEGKAILQKSEADDMHLSEDDVRTQVGHSWGILVSGQLHRLTILQTERELFKEWCRAANSLLSDETRLTADNLSCLAEQSRRFPATTDLVCKVRGLSAKVDKWTGDIKDILASGRKLSVVDVQDLLDAGGRLKVKSDELKALKKKFDASQDWLNKVIEYTHGECVVDVQAVKKLIHEYDNLLVELPEEVEELRQVVVGYCICRRPYKGFMIGCDTCEEWYHGPCIGVSESKASRFEKFICIRCSTKNIFESSATAAAGLIRKWTCTRDLKKSRQVDYQKIQRKFRKEKKDIEKYTNIIKEAELQLSVLLQLDKSDGENNVRNTISSLSDVSHEIPGNAQSVPQLAIGNKSSDLPTSLTERDTGISHLCTNGTVHPTESTFMDETESTLESVGEPEELQATKKAKIQAKLHQAKLFVSQAKDQLGIISNQSRQRKVTEARENELTMVLRRWVLYVRDKVLVPVNMVQAEKARPRFGEFLSQPMKDVLNDAHRLGVADLPDILSMENHFNCMSWSLTALAYIRRKPTIHEVNYILASRDELNLPDEKAVRTLKYMANRANQCQIRIRNALSPKQGDKKPISVSFLQDILQMAQDLPLYVPEEKFLQAAIDDQGSRHCICGGPNNGLEMLQCDACNNWFHSACVGGNECVVGEIWLCQFCGGPSAPSNTHVSDDINHFTPIEPLPIENANSSRLPDPKRLWPPFGLRGSKESVEALGLECSAIPEVSVLNFVTSFPSEKREPDKEVGK